MPEPKPPCGTRKSDAPWRKGATCALVGALAIMSAGISPTAAESPPVVERLAPTPLRASDLAVTDDAIWVASRGGGLYAIGHDGGILVHVDVKDGLPSADVLRVVVARGGLIYAGTQRGLVAVTPGGEARPVPLPPGADPALQTAPVDLIVASGLEDAILFQVTRETVVGKHGPQATMWKLANGEVRPWSPPQLAAAEATAGARGHDGCIHVAGVLREAPGQFEPWLARDCGGDIAAWRLGRSAPPGVIGVAALAPDPERDRTILALVSQDGLDPTTQRYRIMEHRTGGEGLTPYCPRARDWDVITGLAIAGDGRLVVARANGRPIALSCGRPPEPLAPAGDSRFVAVTALAAGTSGTLWFATGTGLFRLPDVRGPPEMVYASGDNTIWSNARPGAVSGDGTRVLVSAERDGLVELERQDNGWRAARRWTPATRLPPAIYGPAIYGSGDGDLYVTARSKGILRYADGRWTAIGPAQGLRSGNVLDLAAVPEGRLWVAFGATPFAQNGAGLQLLRPGGTGLMSLAEVPLDRVGALLPWPDGRVWAAMRGGIVEVDSSGRAKRIYGQRVNAMFHNESTGVVAVVGAHIARWAGERFTPILFRIAGAPPGSHGHPVEVVVDDRGRWLILYSSGELILLDAEGRFDSVLGPAEGVPASTRELLFVPATGEVFLGTAREGLFRLTWP